MQRIVLDRGAELLLERLALDELLIHGRVVDARAIAALVFGAIKRHIGVAHDIGGATDRVVDHHDADARANDDALVAYGIGRGDRLDDAPGHRLQRGVIEHAEAQYRKLVPAEPGDDIIAAQRAHEPLGDTAQQLVAT